MRDSLGIVIVIAGLSVAPLGVSFANGGAPMGGGSFSEGSAARTPEDQAKYAYNSGVRSVKKAKDHESDAAKASNEEKRSKALGKANKLYSEALREFTDAVSQQPAMYQAWNYIGFTNRHLGNYDAALSAYAKALELNPTYPDAVEYRAEAYLGLNKIDEAKDAYMMLFRDSRGLADQLMTAMRQWTDARRKDGQGLASGDIEAFSKWIEERAGIAAQTASLATGAPSGWR
jgi:tetratricopeptide (TPR) repeat protein